MGGGGKIYASQTLSTRKKGATCVSEKPSREESGSLLLNLPPKTSRISVLSKRVCSKQEKKKKNFYYPIPAAAACCQQLPLFFIKCCHT